MTMATEDHSGAALVPSCEYDDETGRQYAASHHAGDSKQQQQQPTAGDDGDSHHYYSLSGIRRRWDSRNANENRDGGSGSGSDRRRPPPVTYSPVMLAMLTGNTFNTCQDVQRLYAECQASGSKDRICEVAAHYMELCVKGYVEPDH